MSNKQPVTAKNVLTLPVGIYTLERGVYLRVTASRRFWLFKYQINGVRRELGLGGVEQTLTAVRGKAAQYRALLATGVDPYEMSRCEASAVTKSAKEMRRAKCPTFEAYAEATIDKLSRLRNWSKGTHTAYTGVLRCHAYPFIGDTPVDEVTKHDILRMCRASWNKPTGQLLLMLARMVFDRAEADQLVEESPVQWKGFLDNELPSAAVMAKGKLPKHFDAVSANTLSEIAKELLMIEDLRAKCALFGFLTVGRTVEYVLARWDEIDLDAGVMVVPPSRRKDRKSENFRVPLSTWAIEVLKSIPVSGPYVFSNGGRKPIYRSGLSGYLKRFTDEPITAHGTRSTFSDWCAQNDVNPMVSEKCLMHTFGGSVFRAYQRDDLLEKRRALLQTWGDFLLGDKEN